MRILPFLFAILPTAHGSLELIVDPSRSSINFSVQATAHTIEGHVISFSSDIRFEPGDDFPDSVEIRFNVSSLTTDHNERDVEMLKWLDAETYPEVAYEMTEITGTGSTRVAEGSLTLHGVTRAVTIPVTVNTRGQTVVISGEAEIDTHNFRLPKIRRALVMSVAPTVLIEFEVIGKLD